MYRRTSFASLRSQTRPSPKSIPIIAASANQKPTHGISLLVFPQSRCVNTIAACGERERRRRAFLRGESSRRAFLREQRALARDAPAIPGEVPIRAHHALPRDPHPHHIGPPPAPP